MVALQRAFFCICLSVIFGGCRQQPPEVVQASAEPDPSAAVAEAPPERAPPWAREGYKRPPIIDFHGHLSLYGVERIEAILDDLSIDKMINLSGGSGRKGERAWLLSQILSERLKGRIVNFANVDWQGFGLAGWGTREADRLQYVVLHRGFRGLKISKALGLGVVDRDDKLVAVDDPRLAPLWQKAAALGIPVSIHVADPRAFWEPLTASNERYKELSVHPSWSYADKDVTSWSGLLDAQERLFKAHPKTTFVAVHFGNAAEDIERVDRLLDACPNVWIDIAARVGEFGRHPAERVRAFLLKHGDRVLFATDIGIADDYLMLGSNGAIVPRLKDVRPFYEAHFRYLEADQRQIAHPSPIQGDWLVDAVALPDALLDKLYRGNAERLLAQAEGAIARFRAPSPQ